MQGNSKVLWFHRYVLLAWFKWLGFYLAAERVRSVVCFLQLSKRKETQRGLMYTEVTFNNAGVVREKHSPYIWLQSLSFFSVSFFFFFFFNQAKKLHLRSNSYEIVTPEFKYFRRETSQN